MIKKISIIFSLIILIFIVFFTNNSYASTISSDINGIDEGKYPEIKKLIQDLQSKHPNWKFQVEYTGLDFNNVVINECQGHGASPKNLSPASNDSYSGMWICPICGKKLYDSEKWYCASEEAIRYMMDTRNSLNENDIFQFLDLSYTDNSSINNSVTETDMVISSTNFEIAPNVDFNAVKQKYPSAIMKDSNGNDLPNDLIITGNKIIIDNVTYTIIKKGDVNKDGQVNIVDAVNMLNSITGKMQLDDVSNLSGKIKGTGAINIVDVVSVLNNITGKQNISIYIETETQSNNNLASGVEQMSKKMSFLDNDAIQAILNASNKYKVNPLYLMARLYQEQGAGTSPLANGSGQNGDYVGFYNLFNINASGNSKEKIIKNGLSYAYSKGWDTKAKSIEGGAEIIANSYINKNQDTLYYQKFNVVGTTGLYNHQYMQNILAAQSEAKTLRNTYISIDPNLQNTYVFTIPVYENMPKSACSRPDTSISNTINYSQKTVSVDTSLKVRASASTSAEVITSLKNNYKVKVIKTTSEKIDNHYWSLIVCETNGAYGYVANDYLK